MRQTNVTTALFIISLTALSACQSVPTASDKMRAQGAEYATMAKQWDKGQAQIKQGEKLVRQGKNEIRAGEKKVKKGRNLIDSGRKLVRESEKKFGDE